MTDNPRIIRLKWWIAAMMIKFYRWEWRVALWVNDKSAKWGRKAQGRLQKAIVRRNAILTREQIVKEFYQGWGKYLFNKDLTNDQVKSVAADLKGIVEFPWEIDE